jgi:hypothetical protein
MDGIPLLMHLYNCFLFIAIADEWYCHICRPDGQDHLLQYSKAVLFHGLRHLARRQAIRDGNGPVIIDDWRLELIDFWNGRHHNYLKLDHNLLIG